MSRTDRERPRDVESDLRHEESGSMSFLETVERARAFLERNGRVSLRALQREFNLDDDALGELIEELVEIQRVAVRDGSALAWAGGVAPPPTGTPEHERSPRDYTPKHLADRILQSKSALEGERKQVTVLFADVRARWSWPISSTPRSGAASWSASSRS